MGGCSTRPPRTRASGATQLLFSFELCWPLLYVGGQAFFRILALEENLLVFAFHGQCGFHRNLPAGLHGALDASDGLRGFVWRTELARVFHDVFHEAIA